MTHEVLAERIRAFSKLSHTITGIACVMVVAPPWLLWLSSHFGWIARDSSWPITATITCFFGSFPLWCAVSYWGLRKYDLLCPHCCRSLAHRYPLVLKTGACSHCHRSVVGAST